MKQTPRPAGPDLITLRSRAHLVLAGSLPPLVALLLVGGAASSRAQSVPISLRSSQQSPVSGAVVLSAEVAPDPGLLAVQFKLDGHGLDAPDTTPPYEVVWSAASAASGQHTVTAVARYRSGAIVESTPLRLVVANPPTFNRILYVDAASGDDGRDGLTPVTGWRTLAKANRSAVAGDTVLLRGVFTGQHIRPAVSGTPAKPISFKSYPGQTAVLDGGLSGTAVSLDARNFVVLEGLRIQNVSGYAVMLNPGSHRNVLRRSTITDISGPWAHAIRIEGASDNLIEGNEILNVGNEAANSGDSIYVVSGSHRNRLLNNTIHNGGHSLIQMGSHKSTAMSRDNVIAGNTLSNFWTTPIILAWQSERTLLEYNKISDGARNGVNYPRPGIQIASSGNVIRYNEIFNNAAAGVMLAAYTYRGTIPQDATGNQIYHNVFYRNNLIQDRVNNSGAIHLRESNSRSVRDNLIANNIFFRNDGFAFAGNHCAITITHYGNPTAWPVGSLNGNRFQHNIFLRQPGTAGEPMALRIRSADHGGNLTYTLARFQATHPEASGNLELDPLFTDEAKHLFTLRPDSPAVGRGLRIPGVGYRGPAPDIGAFAIDLERRSSAKP